MITDKFGIFPEGPANIGDRSVFAITNIGNLLRATVRPMKAEADTRLASVPVSEVR